MLLSFILHLGAISLFTPARPNGPVAIRRRRRHRARTSARPNVSAPALLFFPYFPFFILHLYHSSNLLREM
jgi:hypothetical protein